MKTWLKGGLILPDRIVENGLLAYEGGKITGLWDLEKEPPPLDDPEYHTREHEDLIDGYVAPGYIDLHVHGGGGADFMDADPEAVATITETHARYGTTGLLATTLAAPEEAILRTLRAIKAAPRRGARILGVHIEGPFISPRWKGSQSERHIRPASVAEIDRWLAEGAPDGRWHVTIAPEAVGAAAAIRYLAVRGAVISAGHTDCTFEQMRKAAAAGLSHVTHLYNTMRGLHHREPGPIGAALTLPGLTAELIADGVHVHPAALALAASARASHLILVTDAMRAAGLGDGEYRLGDHMTLVRDGAARLPDGTLAGSVLTMERAVQNMVRLAGVDVPAAVAMASLHPARIHRLDARKGSLAVGKDADLLLLDRDLNVQATIIGGETVYDRR